MSLLVIKTSHPYDAMYRMACYPGKQEHLPMDNMPSEGMRVWTRLPWVKIRAKLAPRDLPGCHKWATLVSQVCHNLAVC